MPRSVLALLAALTLFPAACRERPPADFPHAMDGPALRTWRVYGGDAASTQFSALDQIHTGNVGRLEVAWTYRTGDARLGGRTQIQCNPIVIDSVLYATSAGLKAFALHAATGEELWTFDPLAGSGPRSLGVNRGVAYWSDGDDRRILYTAGSNLYALDAGTGEPVATFGDGGTVDLRRGLGRDASELFVIATTPGAVYEDLLILGSRVHEGPGPSAPGHVRAYDVRTGEIAWIFHTIPHPGEFGYETWPEDAWTRVGGANAWSGITVDHERGMAFVPTGSAAFDFWGGDRHGENLFANTLLALDAATGERIWHYQVVRHDIWDRDLPAAPNLVTVVHDGRRIDAVAQITKSGHVFVLDRDTGAPLFPVEEVEVPPSDLGGEEAWPVQRLPLEPPPFARQVFTEADITDLSPESHADVAAWFDRGIRSAGQWVPPSTEGTVIFPGFDGGGEWGGAAFDPAAGVLYVNANEMPWILTMVDLSERRARGSGVYGLHCASCHGAGREGTPGQGYPPLTGLEDRLSRGEVAAQIRNGKGLMPAFAHLSEDDLVAVVDFLFGADEAGGGEAGGAGASPYGHTGYNRFLDPEGYPAVKPPWGTLNAIDLNRGEILWQVPLGEFPELTARGIPRTGTENYGGPVATAGGLLFIGASRDEHFRAFDRASGEELWKTKLPAGGYATPATYEVNGRQYVVIAAGGGKMGTESGDSYVAFALPD